MGLNKTVPNYQEEGVIKLLKDVRDSLAGRIDIPSKLPKDTRLSFDNINKIKENISKKDQELDEIKKRIGRIFVCPMIY